MSKAQFELVGDGRTQVTRRLPAKLDAALAQVKPMFAEWLKTEAAFIHDTAIVARAVRHAFDLYQAVNTEGRVGFARLFDTKIPEGAKTRDLGENRTYNRLNYLIDKVAGRPAGEDDRQERAPRLSAEERKAAMHATWLSWRRKHAKAPITIDEVEDLLKKLLAEAFSEQAAEEVIAA